MNKEARQFIILWILGCLISVLFIFYDNIFTKKSTEEIPPSPIVNEETNNKTKTILLKDDYNYSGNLNIVIPSFFYNSWFDLLSNAIEERYWFTITYQLINTIDEYTNILNRKDADVILLPTDILRWQAFERINLGEDITPFFDWVFSELLKTRADFLPFSIDPLITLYDKNININNTETSSLISYVLFWKEKTKNTMPILWGIWNNDLLFLKQNKEVFENYFSILYHLLYWFIANEDIQGLKSFIELDKTTNNTYNTKKLLSLKNSLIKQNNYCETYPAICVFALDYADIKFWFLSDLDIINKHFDETNITNISINSFPNFEKTDKYKIRGWWFVSPSSNNGKNELRTLFFYEYLKWAINDDYNIFKNLYTLSAIANNNKKYSIIYKNLLRFHNKYNLIFNSLDTQQNFLSQTKTLNVLEWNYSIEKFVDNLKRSR